MDFEEFVNALCKPGTDIIGEMTAEQSHMLHMAIGVAGEAGELLDAIKKHVIYQKPLDMINVIEEMGDIEFYMQGLRSALGITVGQTIQHCTDKLSVRYAGLKYSNEAAQQRADKDDEAQ